MPTVRFHLKRPRKKGQLRVDEVSIYGMFTLTAEDRFVVTTEEKIEPKFWDNRSQSVKSSHRHHIDINNYLSDFKRDLLNLWRQNRSFLTFDEFKTLAQQSVNPSQKKTLFNAYDKFLKSYESECDQKTVFKYKQLLDLLQQYNQKRPIDLQTLDLNFYDSFKVFLYSQPNQQYQNFQLVKEGEYYIIQLGKGNPVPLLDNTVYKFIANLKNFLRWCEDRGYIVHPSFKKWHIIRRTEKPLTLTLQELERLEAFNFSDLDMIIRVYNLRDTVLNKLRIKPENAETFIYQKAKEISNALDVSRDYLVFECRTGQRISDIKRFNIADFDAHYNTWSFNRKKGNRIQAKRVTVHFEGYCAPALRILEKYNFSMPAISEQKLNENIKEACKQAGINSVHTEWRYSGAKCIKFMGFKHEFVSTHIARKTFITLALHYLPEKIVRDLTGISDSKTLKHYEADSESGIIRQQLKDMDSKIRSA